MYEQNFIPTSKGLIKSAPSSLIPDGSYSETMNVRFGDGYVEKVQGFRLFYNGDNEGFDNSVMHIGQYITDDNYAYSVIHTRDGVYFLNDGYQYDEEDTGTGGKQPIDPDDPSGDNERHRIIIIQSPHQTIKVFVFKQIYEQQESSFYTMRGATVKGNGWIIQASIQADAGYVAGELNYPDETEINGDIIIQATEATQTELPDDFYKELYWVRTEGTGSWGGEYSLLSETQDGTSGQYLTDNSPDWRPQNRRIYRVTHPTNQLPQYLFRLFNVYYYNGPVMGDRNVTDLTIDLENKLGLVTASRVIEGSQWLDSINFSHWNTQQVETIDRLVVDCSRLKSIGNISNWNTSSLTSVNEVVQSSQYLTSLDLSNWTTPVLRSATNIFSGSYAKILDISNWDTEHLTQFSVGGANMEYLIMDENEVKFSGELKCHHPNNYIKYLVPASMVDTYKQHPNWSDWADQIDSVDNYIIERYNGQILVSPKGA